MNSIHLKRYSGFILLVLVVASAFAPVDVPFKLDSVARIVPLRQWILAKGTDGSLTVTLHDHQQGQILEAEGYQFDRGDLVRMHFNKSDSSATYLRKGDPAVSISSNTLGEQLVALKTQLAVEEANLGVVATGQKQELIRQLEEERNLAKENLKLQKKAYDRAKQLFGDGVVPLAELELAENLHEAAVLQLKVAENALNVAVTGEKKEIVSLASSTIKSLKEQIAFLEDKATRYTLNAPFDGLIRTELSIEGDRIFLEDTAASVLFIPVRVRDSRFIHTGQEIKLTLPDNRRVFTSTVQEVGQQVQLLNTEQVIVVKAITREKGLPLGMPIQCTIDCGNVRILEFLKRSVQW
ncbi:MAG: hypothetical protein IPH04_21445 [Saprospirales bacterium]|nr:hypothetical protein [Saprospirales bacterium]MBK6905290.1 hypothetical protein [Saprospirales bacterium]MBK7335041.1 hypothetical protein [Saprospirales bacterium]